MTTSRTDEHWQKWGEIDPYFGVLSAPAFRKDQLSQHKAEFFASGENYVSGRLDAARKYFNFTAGGHAFDFGCGVGRLAIPLAGHFDQVVGVDVAEAMLAEARSNAAERGLSNISFLKSDGEAFTPKRGYRFVNSYIVLQHIPVGRGMAYIDQLLDLVAVGGVAALHVSVSRRMGTARNLLYKCKRHVPGVLGLVNLLRKRRYDEPLMEMNEYSLLDILQLAEAKGFSESVVSTETHSGVLTTSLLCQRQR